MRKVFFDGLLLGLAPFLERFFAVVWDELALRLTPVVVGEADLPLVAGDMDGVLFLWRLEFGGNAFFESQKTKNKNVKSGFKRLERWRLR